MPHRDHTTSKNCNTETVLDATGFRSLSAITPNQSCFTCLAKKVSVQLIEVLNVRC